MNRINLFKELIPKKSLSGRIIKPLGISLFFIVMFVFTLSVLKNISKQKLLRENRESLLNNIQTLETELSKRAMPLPSRTIGSQGTWTDLMWKLSTATFEDIIMKRIELTAQNGEQKRIVIQGEASSHHILQKWMTALLGWFPKFELSIDEQALNQQGVQFKISLKSI